MAMANQIAQTIFGGAPTDNLAAVDVYKLASSDTLNTIAGAARDVGMKAIDLLNDPVSIRNAMDLIMANAAGASKMQLLQEGLAMMGGNMATVVNRVSNGILNKCAAYIGASPEMAGQVMAVVNNASRYYMTGQRRGDTQDLFDLVRAVSGNSELARVVDLETEAALLAGMMDQASRMGMVQLWDDISSLASDQSSLYKAFEYSVVTAIAMGDLDGVQKTLDKIGPDGVLARNPDAISLLLAAYSFPEGLKESEYPTELAKFKSILTQLNAHWYQYQRPDGTWGPDLTNLTMVGQDAKTLFQGDPELADMVLVGPGYVAITVQAVSAELYPNAIVSLRTAA